MGPIFWAKEILLRKIFFYKSLFLLVSFLLGSFVKFGIGPSSFFTVFSLNSIGFFTFIFFTFQITPNQRCSCRPHGPDSVVFGIKCQSTGRMLLFPALDKTKETVHPIIVEHIEQGADIISDKYRTYISQNRRSQIEGYGFDHFFINHSLHFVNPIQPFVHTNNIERVRRSLKTSISRVKRNFPCLLITDKNKWKEEEEKVTKYSNICIEYRNKLDKIIAAAKFIYENALYLHIK